MHQHTGIRISDFWFEGSKLYVDLHEDAIGFFDNYGTTGGMINTGIFVNSILSLPGISSFEVLVGGQRGVEGNHFNFGSVILVENGEIVGLEPIDIDSSGNESLNIPPAQEPGSDWVNLGVLSIPPAGWNYSVNDSEAFAPIDISVFGQGANGLINMAVWGVTVGDPSMLINEFSSQRAFIFDDGRTGYMLEGSIFESDALVVWYQPDLSIALSLFNDGDSFVFADNEEMITRIARTLTSQ